jgi:hypothetical protein
MRKFLGILVVLTVILATSGCVDQFIKGVSDAGDRLFEGDVATDATIAEINAVAKLKSDAGKLEGFLAIAGRGNLSSQSQIHLVKPVMEKLYFDSAKEEVMLVLIKNPAFGQKTKKEVLKRLGKIKCEENRMNVLRAINNKQIGVKQFPGQ